jgi:hypothetical protein
MVHIGHCEQDHIGPWAKKKLLGVVFAFTSALSTFSGS